jgi:hypothetical protein
MISKDLQIDRIDPPQLSNLLRLFDPPAGAAPAAGGGLLDRLVGGSSSEPPPERYQLRPVIVLCREEQPLRLLQLGGGTLPLGTLRSTRVEHLRAFRRSHRPPFVVVIDVGVLGEIWAEAQQAIKLEDDLVAQQLELLRVLRRAIDRGRLVIEPRAFGALPIPPYGLLQRNFDRILPDGRSLVFYLVDRGRIWTSLIVAKRGGDITTITSHQAIADEVRFSAIRRDAPRVLQAVSRRFGPPHIGLFVPLRAWHQLVHGDRSAIARAVAGRQALLDPCPPWLLAIIGAGAMSEAATRSAKLAGKLLARSPLPFAGGAEKLVKTVANPLDALGIDPWEALAWARDWSRRLGVLR